MGLDTTHDAWHGAYSAFMRWRTAIAKAAGIPLLLMDGYHRCPPDWHPSIIAAKAHRAQLEAVGTYVDLLAAWALDVDDLLPLSWEPYAGDALVVLLHHSDCEGEIAVEHLRPLADRLEGLLPKLEKAGDAGGHVGNVADKTRTFIAGLRRAADVGEPLGFH